MQRKMLLPLLLIIIYVHMCEWMNNFAGCSLSFNSWGAYGENQMNLHEQISMTSFNSQMINILCSNIM